MLGDIARGLKTEMMNELKGEKAFLGVPIYGCTNDNFYH